MAKNVIKNAITSLKRKKNEEYWDIIDLAVADAIEDVAFYSKTVIDNEKLEELVNELIYDIEDLIIPRLEEIGGCFPIIENNEEEGECHVSENSKAS